MSDQQPYTTASGREVRKVGKRDISGALAQLRAAREGGDKRTDQYQVQEANKIFEVIEDEAEYERIQDRHKNDDFIVDDEGYGYRDHGGEIWEVDDEDAEEDPAKKKKKRKLDVSNSTLKYAAERAADHKLHDALIHAR